MSRGCDCNKDNLDHVFGNVRVCLYLSARLSQTQPRSGHNDQLRNKGLPNPFFVGQSSLLIETGNFKNLVSWEPFLAHGLA